MREKEKEKKKIFKVAGNFVWTLPAAQRGGAAHGRAQGCCRKGPAPPRQGVGRVKGRRVGAALLSWVSSRMGGSGS